MYLFIQVGVNRFLRIFELFHGDKSRDAFKGFKQDAKMVGWHFWRFFLDKVTDGLKIYYDWTIMPFNDNIDLID